MTTDGSILPPSPTGELAALRRENELLRTRQQQRIQRLEDQTRKMEWMEYQFQLLLRRLAGRSAERVDPAQMALFEKLLGAAEEAGG